MYKTFLFVVIYIDVWIGLRNLLHHVSYSRPQERVASILWNGLLKYLSRYVPQTYSSLKLKGLQSSSNSLVLLWFRGYRLLTAIAQTYYNKIFSYSL